VTKWVLGILATLVGTVIVVASEVLAGFLTPVRVGSVYLPISWVIVVLGVFAGVLLARHGADSGAATIVPVIAWFYTLFKLTTATQAGDLVVPGTWVGYGMLLLGVTAMLIALYVAVVRPDLRGGAFSPVAAASRAGNRAGEKAGNSSAKAAQRSSGKR
jgi:hypothetical protein